MDVKEAYKDFFGVEPSDNGTTINYSVLAFAEHYAKLQAGQHETLVIFDDLKRKIFSDELNQRITSIVDDEDYPNDGSVLAGLVQEEIFNYLSSEK